MDLKIAVVCSSNQNRSMEVHSFLSKKGFNIKSFGTGDRVKLPGTAPDRPNIYDFDVTYEEMYDDLEKRDSSYYTQNGVLHMLDRNRRIKPRPERFQESTERFDVILTCEERVFDQVNEDFLKREQKEMTPVHIVNMDIRDNADDATIGALYFSLLLSMMIETDDLDNDVCKILQGFEERSARSILYAIQFY